MVVTTYHLVVVDHITRCRWSWTAPHSLSDRFIHHLPDLHLWTWSHGAVDMAFIFSSGKKQSVGRTDKVSDAFDDEKVKER